MPNMLPKGLWGEVGGEILAADEMWASLPGTTAPRSVTQVWVGDDDGTPVQVWAISALAPTGVAASYTASSQTVTVSWTLPADSTADEWEVKRPDGTIAGSASGLATSFVDVDPVAVTGSYQVTGWLGGKTGGTAASNSLSLGNAAQTYSSTWQGAPTHGPKLTWAAPTYGRPESYNLYISTTSSGPWTLVASIGGGTTEYTYNGFPPNTTRYLQVRPVLSGTEGAVNTVNVTRGAADITNYAVNYHDNCLDGDFNRVSWTVPAYGQPDSYQVWLDGAYLGPLAGNATFWDTQPHWGDCHRYQIRAVFNGVGTFASPDTQQCVYPVRPQNAVAYSFGGGNFQVQWNPPVLGSYQGFRVEVWQNIAGVDTLVRSADWPATTRFLDFSGLNNTAHYVRIRAHSGVIGVNPQRLSTFISTNSFNPWTPQNNIGYFSLPCVPSVGGHTPGG